MRIDTSAQGYSWSNEVLNRQQFEDGLRQDEPELSDEELDKLPISVEVNGCLLYTSSCCEMAASG